MEISNARRSPAQTGKVEADFDRYLEDGDQAALASTIETVSPELRRIALYHAVDSSEAEDLVQATMLAAIERAETFQRGRRLMPWLVGILLNKIAASRRDARKRRDEPETQMRPEPNPLSVADANEVEGLVEEALQQLSPRYREVLSLYLRQGKGGSEIATELQRPQGTIRAQIHRGLRQLREILPPSLALGTLFAFFRRGAQARPKAPRRSGRGAAPSAATPEAVATPLRLARLLPVGIGIGAAAGVLWLTVGLGSGGAKTALAHTGAVLADVLPSDVAPPPGARSEAHSTLRKSAASSSTVGPSVAGIVFVAEDRETGATLADVELSVTTVDTDGQRGNFVLRTGADGSSVLGVDPESLQNISVVPSLEGYHHLRATWDTIVNPIRRGQPVRLPLLATVPAGGIVVDESGRPVADALVHIGTPEVFGLGKWILGRRERTARTDAAGRWSAEIPARPQTLRLRVVHPEHVSDLGFETRLVPPLEELVAGTSRIVLARADPTVVEVVGPRGAPVVGATVRLTEWRDPPHRGIELETDENGRVRFSIPNQDRFLLFATAEGYAQRLRRFRLGADGRHFTIRLHPSVERTFTLVDGAGAPVVGALARRFGEGWHEATPTDAEGSLTLALPKGGRTLFQLRRGRVLGSMVVRLEEASVDGVVVIPSPAIVEGRVDAPPGSLEEGFRVRISMEDGLVIGTRAVQRGATYSVAFLAEGDAVVVEISAPGFHAVRSAPLGLAGGRLTFDAALVSTDALRLTIHGPDGRAVRFAEAAVSEPRQPVRVVDGELAAPTSTRLYARGDGTLRLARPTGPFTLVVTSRTGYAEVPGSLLRNDVQLEAWGRIEGRTYPRPGTAVVLTVDSPLGDPTLPLLDYRATLDPEGRFRFERVPPGAVQVHLATASPETGLRVHVRPGATTEVVLP